MTGGRDAAKARDAAERVVLVCDVIATIVDAGQGAFLSDITVQWAAEMGLIRVGEAIAKIPQPILDRYPGQPWRQIIGMRNFAAHQYDDLDPRRVWRTLTRDVPELRKYLLEVVLPGLTS